MVSMRNGIVSATRSMLVRGFMAFAGVLGSAGARVSAGVAEAVLVYMTVVHVVQMTFM